MNAPPDILGSTAAQYINNAKAFGINCERALQQYRRFFRTGRTDVQLNVPEIRTIEHIETEGNTTKFTLRHGNDLFSESVIIAYQRADQTTRTTLCVSSQLGCAMGCTFCQTAQLGLLKNLTARDIVEQWFAARHQRNQHIDNIVFMGMGEPMDNLDAVLESIEILTDHNGAAIAPARITVSTVGRCAGIRRLATFSNRPGMRSLKLAVSINAPNDTIRSSIMPINRAEPMSALLDAMMQWRDRVLIEYVLIPTVNMQLEHADALATYLQPLRCTVNLIPYNPRQDSPWPAPDEGSIDAFAHRLSKRGMFVTRRRTTGRDVAAACGQLGIATPARVRRQPSGRRASLSIAGITNPAT